METQDALITIIQNRLREKRRFILVDSIKEAETDYESGHVNRGNATDLMGGARRLMELVWSPGFTRGLLETPFHHQIKIQFIISNKQSYRSPYTKVKIWGFVRVISNASKNTPPQTSAKSQHGEARSDVLDLL